MGLRRSVNGNERSASTGKKPPKIHRRPLSIGEETTMDDVCTCGHVLDEHQNGRECCADDCDCIHFEWGDDDA